MNGYLLDTNVVSEWTKPRPNAGVVRWLADTDEDTLFLSVITLGEVGKGVERLAPGARRTRLSTWLTADLPERFEGRLLDVDTAVALTWGRMLGAANEPVAGIDALIAATAVVNNLAIVTRNERHFSFTGVALVNPWT